MIFEAQERERDIDRKRERERGTKVFEVGG